MSRPKREDFATDCAYVDALNDYIDDIDPCPDRIDQGRIAQGIHHREKVREEMRRGCSCGGSMSHNGAAYDFDTSALSTTLFCDHCDGLVSVVTPAPPQG